MKTIHYLENAGRQLLEAIKRPYQRPIDLTIEEKETKARLSGCALMYKEGDIYAMNVGAFQDPGPPQKGWYRGLGIKTGLNVLKGQRLLITPVWGMIHRHNSFE